MSETRFDSNDPDSSPSGRARRSTREGPGNRADRESRRERRRGSERKERVLHTRVSEQLSEEIRQFAEDLRVPASNLVRNVLEEVFTVVDGVTEDVGGLFDDLLQEAQGVRDRMRTGARGHRRSGRRPRDEADVEEEFRRDEAREASDAYLHRSEKPARQTEAEPPAAEAARSTDAEARPSRAPQDADPEPPAAEIFPHVLGWQPLVLNRAFECGRCKRALRAGESAFLGLAREGLTEIALCGRCAGSR